MIIGAMLALVHTDPALVSAHEHRLRRADPMCTLPPPPIPPGHSLPLRPHRRTTPLSTPGSPCGPFSPRGGGGPIVGRQLIELLTGASQAKIMWDRENAEHVFQVRPGRRDASQWILSWVVIWG